MIEMNQAMDRLKDLAALATETSSEKRRELLEGITETFFAAADEFSPRENDLFGQIIGQVAKDLEEQVRSRLSERLSDVSTAPKSLVLQLANDVISVAAPQLLRSKVLKDVDLIEIINKSSGEHQRVIARRETVSESVADALVMKGDDNVLQSLAENLGADLSRGAKEILVQRSENVEALHRPLVDRADLDGDLKHEMYWWVSSALRTHIVNETGADEAMVEEMLREPTSVMAERARETANMSKAEKVIQRTAQLGQLNQDYMVQLLRQGNNEQFLYAFSYLTDVDINTAKRILSDTGYEAVAIACRASSFDLSTFSAIVLLRGGNGKQKGGSEVAALLDTYMQLPEATAKRAIRFWRLRQKTMSARNDAQAATA